MASIAQVGNCGGKKARWTMCCLRKGGTHWVVGLRTVLSCRTLGGQGTDISKALGRRRRTIFLRASSQCSKICGSSITFLSQWRSRYLCRCWVHFCKHVWDMYHICFTLDELFSCTDPSLHFSLGSVRSIGHASRGHTGGISLVSPAVFVVIFNTRRFSSPVFSSCGVAQHPFVDWSVKFPSERPEPTP